MALRHGPSSVFILMDGYDLTAEKFNSATFEEEAETAEVTGFGDTFREHAPTGLASVILELDGAIFHTCSQRSHEIFSTGLSSDPNAPARLALLGPAGSTIGAEVEGFEGAHQTNYKVLATFDDIQRVNATYQMTGAIDAGHIVHPLTSETTDTDTQTSPVDGGTCSTEGGVAHFHLTEFEGWDSITMAIQDSSDDAAYGDLVLSTATSSTGDPVASRKTVVGEVQRYVAGAQLFAGAGPGYGKYLSMFSRGSTY